MTNIHDPGFAKVSAVRELIALIRFSRTKMYTFFKILIKFMFLKKVHKMTFTTACRNLKL